MIIALTYLVRVLVDHVTWLLSTTTAVVSTLSFSGTVTGVDCNPMVWVRSHVQYRNFVFLFTLFLQ